MFNRRCWGFKPGLAKCCLYSLSLWLCEGYRVAEIVKAVSTWPAMRDVWPELMRSQVSEQSFSGFVRQKMFVLVHWWWEEGESRHFGSEHPVLPTQKGRVITPASRRIWACQVVGYVSTVSQGVGVKDTAEAQQLFRILDSHSWIQAPIASHVRCWRGHVKWLIHVGIKQAPHLSPEPSDRFTALAEEAQYSGTYTDLLSTNDGRGQPHKQALVFVFLCMCGRARRRREGSLHNEFQEDWQKLRKRKIKMAQEGHTVMFT